MSRKSRTILHADKKTTAGCNWQTSRAEGTATRNTEEINKQEYSGKFSFTIFREFISVYGIVFWNEKLQVKDQIQEVIIDELRAKQ
jgi:hypothetical protein